MTRRASTGPVAANDPVEAAIAEGKIPESRRGHYLKLMAKKPNKTRKLLARLEPCLPTSEEREGMVGYEQFAGSQPQAAPTGPNGPTAYPKEWLANARVPAASVGAARGGGIMFENPEAAAMSVPGANVGLG